MNKCDFNTLITRYETGGLDMTAKRHIQQCSTCRQRFMDYITLTGAMTIAGCIPEEEQQDFPPCTELPGKLKELAAGRKKKWQKQQMAGVFTLANIKKSEQQDIIDRLLGEEPDALPKAAFPDDLDDDNDDN